MNAVTLSRQAGRRYPQARAAVGAPYAYWLPSKGATFTVVPVVDVELSLDVVRTVSLQLEVRRTQSLSLDVVRTLPFTLEVTS